MGAENATARAWAHATGPLRQPTPGEVRTLRLLDRRDRPAMAAPTPVTVVVSAACPVCGAARGEPEDMTVVDDGTGEEYVVSRWRNSCRHHDLHCDVLVEAERFSLQRPA